MPVTVAARPICLRKIKHGETKYDEDGIVGGKDDNSEVKLFAPETPSVVRVGTKEAQKGGGNRRSGGDHDAKEEGLGNGRVKRCPGTIQG